MKKTLITGWIVCWLLANFFPVKAQNLVPNPSFEIYDWCPPGDNTSFGPPYPCPPWQNGNDGNIDYFNPCGDSEYNSPNNILGYQDPHSGVAYGGLFVRHHINSIREYFQSPLLAPLEAGVTYYVEFYVSRAALWCAVSHIGAYLSEMPPPFNSNQVINVTPQIDYLFGYMYEEVEWIPVTGCFVAEGGEMYITIGNFYDNDNTPTDSCYSGSGVSYLYIDDVSVIAAGDPADPLDLDLDDSAVSCYAYEIDPEQSGVVYFWSDGSNEPTLTVYQSGTYALTITNGCNVGVDSIEVEIEGAPPLDIPLDPFTLCAGETYDVVLDPQWNYEWNDGSTASTYTITEGGTYIVTMDDGCQESSDTIIVQDATLPYFSLGPDVNLCPGDEINFSLDADLGDFQWQDGNINPDYTITSDGTYILTITNICGSQEDELIVTALPLPSVFLGGNIQLCEGTPYVISLDPMFDYVWQDGANDSAYTITTGGNYSVTATNFCGSDSDQISVEEIIPPGVNLGNDLHICSAQLPYTLVAQYYGATGIEWQDQTTADTLLILAGGTYSVTVSNQCFSVADTINIEVGNANVQVMLPADSQLCSGDSLLLTNAGDPGDFIWQNGSHEDSLWVFSGGTYALTVSNVCGSGSDSVIVDMIADLQNPDLGPDLSLCPGEQFALHPGITGVTYLWQDMSTADSLIISVPGIYSVQVANGCSSAVDTVVVSVNNNPPNIDLPEQLNICQGDTLLLESGIGGVDFLWSDGSQNSSIEVATPGIYSLTVNNACGMDADTVIILDSGPLPSVALSADISICPGETVTINPVAADVQSWLWQDGSTLSTFVANQAGVIIVEVTNVCGSSVDSLIVTALPAIPLLDIGSDTSLCPGEMITFSILTPGVNILWPDGSSTSSFTVSGDAIVHAEISNQCGVSTDDLVVTLLDVTPVLDLGPDQFLCPGETIHLSPGLADVDYEWQDGTNLTTYEVTTPGIVALTISNDCGFATDTIEIIEDTSGPDIDLGADITGCAGDVVTLEANVGGVDYLWQDGSTDADLLVGTSGLYILQVSNACGLDIDSIVVDLYTQIPAPDLGPDTTLCNGQQLQLNSQAPVGTNVIWQDGSTSPVLTVASTGTYILSESNICGTVSDSVIVQYESPPPSVDLGPDTVLCPGEFILLHVPSTSAAITWQDGSSDTVMMADLGQKYSIALSNLCGDVMDEINIRYDDDVPVLQLDSLQWICPGEEVVMDATQSFDALYQWSNGSKLPILKVSQPGHYSVQVTALCGEAEQAVEVGVSDDCANEIYIPNVFSPNEDFINDQWEVFVGSALDVQTVTCTIFDRWGNLVFEKKTMPVVWDGMFQGRLLNPGVYVYRISVEYVEGVSVQRQILSGDVTILK